VLVAAKKLADILRSKKAFTNTATFDLKCEVSAHSENKINPYRADLLRCPVQITPSTEDLRISCFFSP
jgi:hypothetical protein